VLGLIICVVGAFRLSTTPLMTVTVVLAVANAVCFAWRVAVSVRGGRDCPRLVMIVQHGSTALAVFLVFVSFSLS